MDCFQAKFPVFAHTSLGDQSSPNDAFVIGVFRHIKLRFDCVPICLEFLIAREILLNLIVLVACANQRLVIPVLHRVFVLGNSATRFLTWQGGSRSTTRAMDLSKRLPAEARLSAARNNPSTLNGHNVIGTNSHSYSF